MNLFDVAIGLVLLYTCFRVVVEIVNVAFNIAIIAVMLCVLMYGISNTPDHANLPESIRTSITPEKYGSLRDAVLNSTLTRTVKDTTWAMMDSIVFQSVLQKLVRPASGASPAAAAGSSGGEKDKQLSLD